MNCSQTSLAIIQHTPSPINISSSKKKLSRAFEGLSVPISFLHKSNRILVEQQLDQDNYVATVCYNPINTLYICSIDEQKERINRHFYQTRAYTALNLIEPVDYSDFIEEHFRSLIDSIENELHQMWIHNHIDFETYQSIMNYDKRHNQLNQLEFIADASSDTIRFLPLIRNQFKIMSELDDFLTKRLQTQHTMFTSDKVIQSSTHLVKMMEIFFEKPPRPSSSSSFVVLTIENLYETFDHHQCLLILSEFLEQRVQLETTSNDLTNDGFIKLVRLFLESQCFTFDGSIYQQTRGGSRRSSLIQILADLCFNHWEESLRREVENDQQIMFRHENQLIFTWNQPIDHLNHLLNDLKNHELKFKFNFIVDRSVQFMDIELSQSNDNFECSIKRLFLPDVVTQPYFAQVAIQNYRTGIHEHLIQTVQCSSQVKNFLDELELLQAMDMIHSYPKGFLDKCLEKFFNEFNHGQRFDLDNEHIYIELRKYLLLQ